MKRYLLFVLAVYGAYYCCDRYFNIEAVVDYAKKNPSAHWVEPVRYYGGLVYYQRAEYPKAQEMFSRLLADDPTGYYTVKALFYLEDSAEYNRDWETARTALLRYIEEFPEGKDSKLMQQRLVMLNYQHPSGPGQ